MKKWLSILVGALLAGSAAHALAADPPGANNEQRKQQQTQGKPPDKAKAKPSANQRRSNVPET